MTSTDELRKLYAEQPERPAPARLKIAWDALPSLLNELDRLRSLLEKRTAQQHTVDRLTRELDDYKQSLPGVFDDIERGELFDALATLGRLAEKDTTEGTTDGPA